MRTTTTAVLAVGATALAIPTTAAHAQVSSVQAPLAGHLTVAQQMRAEHTELAQQRLTRKAWRLADKVADARDRGFSPRAYRRRVKDDSPATLARRVRELRRDLRSARRAERRRASGRHRLPHARGDRRLRVRRQPRHRHRQRVLRQVPVHAQTWASVGGSGNPAAAGEAEQNRRAAMLYAREGASPWPVCGR